MRKISDRLGGEEDAGGDPVLAYVTFLAARQLFDALKAREPDRHRQSAPFVLSGKKKTHGFNTIECKSFLDLKRPSMTS